MPTNKAHLCFWPLLIFCVDQCGFLMFLIFYLLGYMGGFDNNLIKCLYFESLFIGSFYSSMLWLLTKLSFFFWQELSDMTAIKAEDILTTLQSLELIQYRKGQHVICADPKVLDRHLKAAGRGGLDVDVSKLIWTPYKEQS